jgi:hypothetical protein
MRLTAANSTGASTRMTAMLVISQNSGVRTS